MKKSIRPIGRFLAWWGGISALLGPFSVCPFCGRLGCPGGAASAGFFGAIIAGIIFIGRGLTGMLKRAIGAMKGK